jgi:cyclophilin family peptidyl-prolyl cis-trans isomerase/HEAT repeat protein
MNIMHRLLPAPIRRVVGVAGAAAALLSGVLAPRAVAAQDAAASLRPVASEWQRVLEAEDARAATRTQLATLVAATRSAEPELRRVAVRALGRLERAEVATHIAPLLRDERARVREAAAHALAQSVSRQERGAVRGVIAQALANERNDTVRGALAESLGRMPHADAEMAAVTLAQIAPLLAAGGAAQLGALRGSHFLVRQAAARPAFDDDVVAALRALATASAAAAPEAARVRTLALATLTLADRVDAATLERARGDVSALVRREAALAAATLPDTAAAREHLDAALADDAAMVRFEALRSYGRRFAASRGCGPVRALISDVDTHVALHAIGLLGGPCEVMPYDLARLDSIARMLAGPRDGNWHRATHALVALAAKSAAHARERLPAFVSYPNYFVRTHAARAATLLGDTTLLGQLASDAHPNVRTTAVAGLRATAGAAADDVFLAQLRQDDSQLLQAAAAALEGSTAAAAPYALLDALDRISATRSETARDARRALLVRVRELGSATHVPRVGAYLTDYDPVIAELAADVLEHWTGERPAAAPSPAPAVRLPGFEEIAALDGQRLVIAMDDGGEIELRLHAFDAPTNVARFARLADSGYYDGLTLHRVVPNFVVQGGSPNANEYAGDAPFTRDELGLRNWRGSVGLSTRGRDTGDAQLYINTVDNVRLDHDYTIWATVASGMDVVDRLQEGAVMRSVRLR